MKVRWKTEKKKERMEGGFVLKEEYKEAKAGGESRESPGKTGGRHNFSLFMLFLSTNFHRICKSPKSLMPKFCEKFC